MPVVIAGILRTVIIAIVSAVPVTIAENLLDGTVKKLVAALRDESGASEDDAKDIVGNILLDLAVNSTIIGAVVKGKVAVKAAEYLGLTSKGFKKAKLTAKGAAALTKVSGRWEKFKAFGLMSKILSVLTAAAGTIWLGNTFIQAVEPGIYQPRQANNVWEKFLGIRPFPEADVYKSPPPFSESSFTDFAVALERAGILGLNNPWINQTLSYSRTALAELVFAAYGDAVLRGQATTPAKFTPTLSQYFILRNGHTVAAAPTVAAPPQTIRTTTGEPVVSAPAASQTRVFSGVISQGTLGSSEAFMPREDDLITSAGDLETAARNNLALYLAAIPGRLVYEIKIVPSVVARDGTRSVGSVQRVVKSKKKDGSPVYKLVANKFAVAVVYMTTGPGKRTKIAEITLGPVDAVAFQPQTPELAALEQNIKATIITSKPEDIKNINMSGTLTTVQPVALQSPAPAPAAPAVQFAAAPAPPPPVPPPAPLSPPPPAPLAAPSVSASVLEETRRRLQIEADGKLPVPPSQNINRCAAGSVATFFDPAGVSYPSVAERSKLYESWGLGPAAWYTGTAEQNIRLLAELKRRSGCSI